MTEEQALELFKKLDPITLAIIFALIVFIIYKYRKNIVDAIEDWSLGRISKKEGLTTSATNEPQVEEKPSQQDTLLMSIMNVQQTLNELALKQSDMAKTLENMQTSSSHNMRNLSSRIETVSSQCEFLMNSDKEDKKAYIVREYNYFYVRLHKIDLFSKDSLEKVYDLYLMENGDTFVAGLMTAIRTLPVVPHITQEDLSNCNDDIDR